MRGTSPAWLAVGVWLCAQAPVARAQADDPPRLPVADLPPLPRTDAEDRVTGVVVAAGQEAEEMRVTGAAKREQSLGTVASAVTVITGDRLRRFGARKLSEALRSAAGVYVVDDRMTERLGFRGLQLLGDFNTRTLVLVDGLTLTEPWNQFTGIGDDLPVSVDEIQRVEVIRGPVSSVYGTNAFFGIVNIITRPADQSPRAWGRVGGGSFGSAGASAGFAAGSIDEEIRGTVSGTYRGGETVSYPEFADSGADPATSADGMQAGQVGLVARYHGAFAQLRAYRRVRELPGAPYDTHIGDDGNRNTDRHLLAELGYTRTFDRRLTATVRGYAHDYRFTDYLVYSHAGDPDFRDIGDSQWFGGEARARYDLLDQGRLGITAGVELARNLTKSRSYDFPLVDGDAMALTENFNGQGVYGEVDGAPAPWLGFAGGLRFDRSSLYGTHLSPRAALFLDHQDRYGLKLLYADGFRYPGTYECCFDDGMDYKGNPDLGPEGIQSYEVVAWSSPRPAMLLRASAFRWEMNDLIEQEVDPADGLLQFQNIAEMTSTGVELEASVRTTTGWLVFGAASAQEVERQGGAEPATNAPRLVATAGASTPLLARHVHLSTELIGLSSRRTRDEATVDPWLGWHVCAYVPDYRGFDLTVGVRNLIGTRERIPAQEDYDRTDGLAGDVPIMAIPGEGRELYARLGYRY